jgi:hypothetical protein
MPTGKLEELKTERIKPKMRIRLLSPNLGVMSDRLVTQAIELTKGPSEKHDGPFQIEFNLLSQADVQLCKDYMDKLTGQLPLETKELKKVGRKKKEILDPEPIKELLHTAEAKCETQDALIEYLRGLDFVFLTTQSITDFKVPITIKPKHSLYQYMVRRIKEAKNPLNDRYDHQLAIGFRMTGTKKDIVRVYMYGKYFKALKLKWGSEKARTLQKPETLVFPRYMVEEERVKYSVEYRKKQRDPENFKPSKLYSRWEPHVKLK